MGDAPVELDYEPELVVEHVQVCPARSPDEAHLARAARQCMRPLDVTEVAVFECGMDASKVRAEHCGEVEAPAMSTTLVQGLPEQVLGGKPAAESPSDPVDRVDHLSAGVRQIENSFLEPRPWWQADRMFGPFGVQLDMDTHARDRGHPPASRDRHMNG